jgi:hypothetical protein
MGLAGAIGKGLFAEISRTPTGGKGLDGVIQKASNYYNPFPHLMLPETVPQRRDALASAAQEAQYA